ncbi:MAG: hypothetical protein ACOZAR_04990 [Patescibacteria group bacterium]
MRKIFYWFLLVAVLILLGAGWYYYSALWEAQKGIEIKVEGSNVSKPENDSDLAKEDDLTSVTGQGEVVLIDEKNIVIKDIDGRQQSWKIAERPMVQTLNMNNLIYEDSLLADIKVGSNVFLAGLGNDKTRYAHLFQIEFGKRLEGKLFSISGKNFVIEIDGGEKIKVFYDDKTLLKEIKTNQEIVDNFELNVGNYLVLYCDVIENGNYKANVIFQRLIKEDNLQVINIENNSK